jgi:glycosyltransferase involved in cell wall biosynthesis
VRICIIGKFPPIQGGVSMRTYWTAQALAARGHDVHVVTNAKEVRPPFRMLMRPQDWQRCAGAVTMHWTDPVDRSQSYIPMASPFVSKLAALAANAHSARPFDVIYSHYMEPYGIAGHLAAQMTGAPHVVRMAGSDAGRLWHHSQFEALYDHVLRSAALVVATGTVAQRAVQRGVDPGRIVSGGGYALPDDLFTPDGPALDLNALRGEHAGDPELGDQMWGDFSGDRPYFGVYGKLGDRKGSFALLAALQRLKHAGTDVGLVALAHGNSDIELRFREQARQLGLADRILQIPFLPHWRVPEFLRGCLAVCCLEQDFPIGFHSPIIPREVLLSGACLVGSCEVIRKLPQWERLADGYSCVAIKNVNDVESLAERLGAIVRDPHPAIAVGKRGRDFALELEQGIDFPGQIERILAGAAEKGPPANSNSAEPDAVSAPSRFPLALIADATITGSASSGRSANQKNATINLQHARKVLVRMERAVADGRNELHSLKQGVEVEIAIAAAEEEADKFNGADCPDALFRIRGRRWAFEVSDLADFVPVRNSQLRIVNFNFDASKFRDARTIADLPAVAPPGESHVVVFGNSGGDRRDPLLVDGFTARVLEHCDGVRSAGEILMALQGQRVSSPGNDDLKWIEHLFARNLIHLRAKSAGRSDRTATTRRDHKVVSE